MKKLCTLLVDNSACFRDAMQSFLAMLPEIKLIGWAASGEEALTQAQRLGPDLVLMDVNMPGLNGFEVLRRMREMEPPPRVALVSLYDDSVFRHYAKRCGAVALISKINVVTELPPLIGQLIGGVSDTPSRTTRRRTPARQRRSRHLARSVPVNA